MRTLHGQGLTCHVGIKTRLPPIVIDAPERHNRPSGLIS